MEIRELAERVLFAEVLDEKLAPPAGSLTDADPGKAILVPDRPGRPDDLCFEASGERAPLPGAGSLDSDLERGRLLHFFANHELLAAELMALVLLRFPDAPADFRRGVAKTLQEEQMHTRLYRRRLEECGFTFGSQSVNGFFWKAVSSMKTPADYVARLSLTFEQANLDYSRHFAAVFQQAGDERTARILDRIYRDEISHVNYGLEWFRRWKEPGQSDWDSFRNRLVFPLSPSRAKGQKVFNREGRRQAGLDDAFIDQLEVYMQSKGRTPNVYHFNPDAEWSVGRVPQGIAGQAPAKVPKVMVQLAEDLDVLSLFLARQDDVVLMRRVPRVAHLQKLSQLGWSLPEILPCSCDSVTELSKRKLGQVRPWAWSPDSGALLRDLKGSSAHPNLDWRDEWCDLHSKVFSTELGIEAGWGEGQVCSTLAAYEKAAGAMGWRVVVKAPFGVAGRDLRFLSARASSSECSWMEEIMAQQGAVVVEPWYDSEFDFSVQYDSGMKLLGYVGLHNDERGRFRACSVGRPLTASAGEAVTRFFYDRDRGVQRFYEETLPAALKPHLDARGYEGPVGVDAMIARGSGGELFHCPVIEINPRYTMGRVALELSRMVVKGVSMRFEIHSRKSLARGKKTFSFARWNEELEDQEGSAKVITFQNGRRQIQQGVLALNDPVQAQAFLAVLRVGQSAESLLR